MLATPEAGSPEDPRSDERRGAAVQGHPDEDMTGDGRRPAPAARSSSRTDVWNDDRWDRDTWGVDSSWDDVDDAQGGRAGVDREDDTRLLRRKGVKYTAPGSDSASRRPRGRTGPQLHQGETVALMLLVGTGMCAGIGFGLDRLLGTFPALMIVGVFAGFGIALYAIFIETR